MSEPRAKRAKLEADAFLSNMEQELQGPQDPSTLAEQESSDLQPHIPAIDYDTVRSDSFVAFLIDGNVFQFQSDLISNDESGGREAASGFQELAAGIFRKVLPEVRVLPVVLKVFGDPEWLSDTFYDHKIIPHRVNFGRFLQGFNDSKPLLEFVALDRRGPTVPAYRTRDAAHQLAVNLLDPQCRLLAYAGLLDDNIQDIMTNNPAAIANNRLFLLETQSGVPNDPTVFPDLQRIETQGLFRKSPLRLHQARSASFIYRNRSGQRIDPPTHPIESIAQWVRAQKFCNDYFLRGECLNDFCKSRHDGRLDREQLEALRHVARGLPCRHGNGCRDPECYAGHLCPMGGCRMEKCRFWPQMHVADKRIVEHD